MTVEPCLFVSMILSDIKQR